MLDLISKKVLSILFLLVAGIHFPYGQEVSIEIQDLRSDKGQIIIQVFKDDKSFVENKPFQVFPFSKTSVQKGVLTVKCELKEGIYGLALLDDENSNGKMDYNLLKMPKEGFAFSDYYLSGMSRPHFNDFRFTMGKTPLSILMKMRYL